VVKPSEAREGSPGPGMISRCALRCSTRGLAETAVARSKVLAMAEKYILKSVGAVRGLEWCKGEIEACSGTAK
jgi:hypothetical protein